MPSFLVPSTSPFPYGVKTKMPVPDISVRGGGREGKEGGRGEREFRVLDDDDVSGQKVDET